jgi:DNA repair exonuclease SbcCD nuclease subunit
MRILFFNDLHGHRFQQFSRPVEVYGTNRIQRAIEALQWVAELTIQVRPDAVLFGGDLLEDWRSTDWFVYNRIWEAWVKILDACREVGAEIWAIPGNHDMFNLRLEDSAILPLGSLGVRLFGSPQVANGILLRPYEEYPVRWRRERVKVGFAHLGVLELAINGYAIGTTTVDDLGAETIYSGHYHIPSRWRGKSAEIVYTGAIQARNFSDAGEHSFGVSVVDTESNQETRYVNPYGWVFLKASVASYSDLDVIASKSRAYINLTVGSDLRAKAIDWASKLPEDRLIVKVLGHAKPKSPKTAPTRASSTLANYLQKRYVQKAERLLKMAEAIETGTFNIEAALDLV